MLHILRHAILARKIVRRTLQKHGNQLRIKYLTWYLLKVCSNTFREGNESISTMNITASRNHK